MGEEIVLLTCPFCGDTDFDKIGLKLHLKYHCEEYKNLTIETRAEAK